MNAGSISGDDDAVSSVIGVVLMVAVTVILSAVVAGFVFSAFDQGESAPQVTFDYNYDAASSSGSADGTLTISVSSGERFAADQVSFRGTDLGTDGGDANADSEWHQRDAESGPESTVSAGQRATLEGLSDTFELDLVWTAADGGSSATLSTEAGPDA